MLVMTFFWKSKRKGKNGSELLEDVACVGVVGALDGSSDEFVEFVVVDAPVVRAVGSAEYCVGDVGANFVGDGLGGALLCSDDRLVDLVDTVGFVLCVGACGDGWEHRELGG